MGTVTGLRNRPELSGPPTPVAATCLPRCQRAIFQFFLFFAGDKRLCHDPFSTWVLAMANGEWSGLWFPIRAFLAHFSNRLPIYAIYPFVHEPKLAFISLPIVLDFFLT